MILHTTPSHIADYLDDDGWTALAIIERSGAGVVINAPAESEPYYRVYVADSDESSGTEAVIGAPPRVRVEGGCVFVSWDIYDMVITVSIEIVRIEDVTVQR